MAVVYALCCRTSGKIYCGKTIRLRKRLKEHRHGSGSYVSRAIQKHGWHDFVVVLLAAHVTEKKTAELEQFWIAKLHLQDPDCGYNLTAGGEGASGRKPTDATRAKISKANHGRRFGPQGELHRRRIGDASIGRRHTEEERRRMQLAQQRRRAQEKQCQKQT